MPKKLLSRSNGGKFNGTRNTCRIFVVKISSSLTTSSLSLSKMSIKVAIIPRVQELELIEIEIFNLLFREMSHNQEMYLQAETLPISNGICPTRPSPYPCDIKSI